MPRAPSAAQRAPSQRASIEMRTAEAQRADAERRLADKRREEQHSMHSRRHAEKKAAEAAAELARLTKSNVDKSSRKITSEDTWLRRTIDVQLELARHHIEDIPRLVMRAIKRVAKDKEVPLQSVLETLVKQREWKHIRAAIHRVRDKQIYDYLREHVYTPEHFALLRLVLTLSKRSCALIHQSFKYRRLADGSKARQRLAPDSQQWAPPLFSINDIVTVEKAAEEKTGVTLREHPDHRGADVSGARYSLDRHLQSQLDAQDSSRTGGLATAGTNADPDLVCMTGDGACVSGRFTGVSFGSFVGSTEFLNQSSSNFSNWLFYLESSKAEDYTTLKARLAWILPDLRRIYRTRHVSPGGVASSRFIELCLTADKPFMRHICGLTSHNADAFGPPSCACCADDLYNFTFDKRTHYGSDRMSFASMCARAHVPVWEALGEEEPDEWSMYCDRCDKTWTHDGGMAQLEKEREVIERKESSAREKAMKEHAKDHLGQCYGRPPLVPFHHALFDPMHACHNEVNALLDESVHKHLALGADSTNKEVQRVCAHAQATVNQLWRDANLPKHIQFGKVDGKELEHALNGPAFNKAFGTPGLLQNTMNAMDPVWRLRETVPDDFVAGKKAAPAGAEPAPAVQRSGKKVRGKSYTDGPAPKQAQGSAGVQAKGSAGVQVSAQGQRLNGEALPLCTLRECEWSSIGIPTRCVVPP